MRVIAAFATMFLAGQACAEFVALPEFYKVAEQKSNQAINVMAEPSDSSEILSQLDNDQSVVEVVALNSDGNWAKVNAGEASGWVSTQNLQAQDSVWESGKLPEALMCFGTEPFWSVTQEGGKLRMKSMRDDSDRLFPEAEIFDRGFDSDRNRIISAKAGEIEMTSVITDAQCGDGMSDRTYGLKNVMMLKGGANGTEIYSGCCSLRNAQ